jgi:hypothetical protein
MRMSFHNDRSEAEAIESILRGENRRLGSELTSKSWELDQLQLKLNAQIMTHRTVVERLRAELWYMTAVAFVTCGLCGLGIIGLAIWLAY